MSSTTDERSISRLLGDSVEKLSRLVRTEADLARAELSEKLAIGAGAARLIVAGVALLIPALVLILFAAAAGLIELGLSDPLAYLCAGVGGAMAAALLLRAGLARLSAKALWPAATLNELKRDEVAAEEMLQCHAQSDISDDWIGGLNSAIRQNPLPAALIGMGVVWLFSGGASSAAGGVQGAIGAASKIGAQVGASAGTLVRPVTNALTTSNAVARISDLFERQPLLLGAVGIAIGAGVAATLRTTDAESGLFGAASAKLQRETMELAREQVRGASDLVDSVATVVADEARARGLSAEKLKQTADQVQASVKDVFDQTSRRVRDRLK